jgi:hypothetical protein
MRHLSSRFLTALILGIGILTNLAGLCLVATGSEPASGGQRRPNVLILMSDHVDARMLGPESQCLKPNLDR